MDEWQHSVLKIDTSNEEFYRCYNQGVQDMASLRLPLKGTDRMVFVPAAGLPWFVALFGRDTLIASLQAMIVYPEFGAGALEGIRRRSATTTATPSQVRSCTSCATGSSHISN
jgi:glycogen debranching enzyme